MGEIIGKKHTYYENGAFKKVESYYNGKLDSFARSYYPNGNVQREEYYKDGKLLRSKDFNEDGFLVSSSGY
jgi:antitoxin component YwqK of YwqJK toxin-antitoxin module